MALTSSYDRSVMVWDLQRAVLCFLKKGTHVIVVTSPDTTQEMVATTFPDTNGIDVVLANGMDGVMLFQESYKWRCPFR